MEAGKGVENVPAVSSQQSAVSSLNQVGFWRRSSLLLSKAHKGNKTYYTNGTEVAELLIRLRNLEVQVQNLEEQVQTLTLQRDAALNMAERDAALCL
jgi:hypothetical protein